MANVEITGIEEAARSIQADIKRELAAISNLLQQEAKIHTPKKTGNARNNWSKETSNQGFTVENKVPYIGRLEAGASKQAPKGITTPAINSVKRKLNK